MITVTKEKIGNKVISDFLLLNQGALIPVLVDAIQEQQSQIEELKSLVNQLISGKE